MVVLSVIVHNLKAIVLMAKNTLTQKHEEKLAHEVLATEEILRENLFGKKSHAEVILGYLDNVPVSFAQFFHNFSTNRKRWNRTTSKNG